MGPAKLTAHAVKALLMGGAIAFAMPALADDPRDPAMTPDAIARDAATIRRLNREQYDYVRERDAGYAQGWRDYNAARGRSSRAVREAARDYETDSDYAAQRRDYEAARADYAAQRRAYESEMQAWREDVSACHAGYYGNCR